MTHGRDAHEPGEAYEGTATLVLDAHPADEQSGAREVVVTARVRGHFQPIDGRFHWYGRVAAEDGDAVPPSGSTVRLRTPYGEAPGRLSDIDPWGRLRIEGTGRPPF